MKKMIILVLAVLLVGAVTLEAKEYGPFLVDAVLGAAQDTLIVPELYLHVGSASMVGKWVWVASTTDLAAPMNEACQIQKHTSTTGAMILDTTGGAGNAAIGPSAEWTDGDIVWVYDSPPSGALIRKVISEVRVATGVAELDYMLFLQNDVSDIDSSVNNARAAILTIHTAILDGSGEIDTTLENTRAAVALTLAAVADGSGEIDTTLENSRTAIARIETYTDTEVANLRDSLANTNVAIYGANGLPALTGAKIVAAGGVSIGEGLIYEADRTADIDSTVNNVRAATLTIHTAILDGSGEIDTTGENTRTAVARIEVDTDTEVAAILTVANQCSAYVADGTSEIDTTLENNRAAIARIEIDTDTEVAAILTVANQCSAYVADGTSEIDTTLENSRAAIGRIEVDTDTEVAAILTVANQCSAYVADGTSEIDTTLENVRTALARVETYTDTEVGALRDSVEDANDHLQTLVGFGNGYGGLNFLEVTTGAQSVDSTWSSVATHEVAIITGPVEVWIACYDSVSYTGADSIGLLFSGLTPYNKFAKLDVDAGEVVSLHTPPAGGVTIVSHISDLTTSVVTFGPANTVVPVIHAFSANGLDFGYQIYTSSAPAGILVFKIWWRDLSGVSTVVAGAGGAL